MIRTGATLLLAAYWLAIFVATHVPHVPAALAMPGADKWEPLRAYAALAFLLAGRQSLWRPVGWTGFTRIAILAALYGAFDELTQIPVGRHADVNDWFADVLGSAFGLALFAVVRVVFARCCGKPRQA